MRLVDCLSYVKIRSLLSYIIQSYPISRALVASKIVQAYIHKEFQV